MRVAVVAGELSGDIIAAGLIRAMAQLNPSVIFEGVVGPNMTAAGCVAVGGIDRLSVMGLVEVLRFYPAIAGFRKELARRWLSQPPDVFIGVDAPDFNLPLAAKLKAAGIPTLHYVSPTVWAWRQYRLKKIRAAVDRMLVLLPFEADFYVGKGIAVEFVGHPLADEISADLAEKAARDALGITHRQPLIALLPGSRLSEIAALAPLMLDSAGLMLAHRPELAFLIPAAGPECAEQIHALVRAHEVGERVTVLSGRAREAMAAAECVLLASGTAALEAMLVNRPMVITYRMNPLSYRIYRLMDRRSIPFVGLPNLIAGEYLVPEILQGDATPERLSRAVLDWFDRPARRALLRNRFDELHARLAHGASESAARAVLDVVV